MTTISTYDIYQELCSRVNVQQGGQIRPVADFILWYNAVSADLYREKVSKVGLDQMLDDDLATFLVSRNVLVTQQQGKPFGVAPYPADYNAFSNLKILRQKDEQICFMAEDLPIIDGNGECKEYTDPDYAAMRANFAGANLIETTINLIDNQRWPSCLESRLKGPTYDKPKATQYSGGFKVAPKGIQVVVLDYYKTPREATFEYTIGTGDVIIFNSSTSIQLEWSNTLRNEFLTRLEKLYGLHVKDSETYQMAENDKKSLP